MAVTKPQVRPASLVPAAAASEARTSWHEANAEADGEMASRGKALYETDCAACHQENGEGIRGAFPALKASRAVNKPDPTHHIQAVLFGEQGMSVGGVRYLTRMPPFGARLRDPDVAAIVNFERGAWGNHGRPVTVSEVARVRATAAQAGREPGIAEYSGWASSGQNSHDTRFAAAEHNRLRQRWLPSPEMDLHHPRRCSRRQQPWSRGRRLSGSGGMLWVIDAQSGRALRSATSATIRECLCLGRSPARAPRTGTKSW